MKRKPVTDPSQPCCGKCRHFQQHYVRRAENRYIKCACGHCMVTLLRQRLLPQSEACKDFEELS